MVIEVRFYQRRKSKSGRFLRTTPGLGSPPGFVLIDLWDRCFMKDLIGSLAGKTLVKFSD